MVSCEYSEEKLRSLLRGLKDYSNAKIVEIATYIVQIPDAATRKESLRVFCDAVEGLILVSDAPRCLALFYVANEILQRGSEPEFWRSHLGPQLSSFLPRVCAVACQTQEWNVPVNIFRLPHVWRQNHIFPAEFCEELSRRCRESYDDCQNMKAPSLPPLVLPSNQQQQHRSGFDPHQQTAAPSSRPRADAVHPSAARRQQQQQQQQQQAEVFGAKPKIDEAIKIGNDEKIQGTKSRTKHPDGEAGAHRDMPDDVQAMLTALETEKYLGAIHRTQEAVQHIEDLKVKEIAHERMLLEDKIRESTDSLRSLHATRLAQCRTHTETAQVQARNQGELAALEREARELLDAKARVWDADLQRWRQTIHLAASQLPPIEESYRMFHARSGGGGGAAAAGLSSAPPAGGDHAAAGRHRPAAGGEDKAATAAAAWRKMSRAGGGGGVGAAARGGLGAGEGGGASPRFHPYAAASAAGEPLNVRQQSHLRERALREAQAQLEQEGILPISDLAAAYRGGGGGGGVRGGGGGGRGGGGGGGIEREVSREEMFSEGFDSPVGVGGGARLAAAAAAAAAAAGRKGLVRGCIPMGLPCTSPGMSFLAGYSVAAGGAKGDKDLPGGGGGGDGMGGGLGGPGMMGGGPGGGWGMGVGVGPGPGPGAGYAGRMTDLWCSQFFAADAQPPPFSSQSGGGVGASLLGPSSGPGPSTAWNGGLDDLSEDLETDNLEDLRPGMDQWDE